MNYTCHELAAHFDGKLSSKYLMTYFTIRLIHHMTLGMATGEARVLFEKNINRRF